MRNTAVPLARRMMLSDPRRFAASILGVGLALMLILLLDGLSAGIDARVTAYEERSGAALFVAQPGVSSLLGSTSVLPASTLNQVRSESTVKWAATMRGFFAVPQVSGIKIPSYIVGSEPGQPGGPWEIASGKAPTADDEIAVGQQFSQRAGVKVGDSMELIGKSFRVVGIAGDADMFMASFIFMTHKGTDALLHAPTSTSFVLVGTDQPTVTLEHLKASGLNVVTKEQIEKNDLGLKGQTYGTALAVMVMLAFIVGTMVIALSIYAAVIERRRDYGIIKAIGANNARLFRLAAAQSLCLAMAGFVAGLLLFFGSSAFLRAAKPQFSIIMSSQSLIRVLVVAVVMGLFATIVPARRLASMEPAVAFGGG